MSPAAENVLQRLDNTRQKWWLFTLLSTAVLAAAVSFAVLLVFTLTDALVKFSQTWLAVLFAVWLGVTGTLVAIVVRRLVRNNRSLEATARRIEAELPELGSDLINLVQLSKGEKNGDDAFCEAAIQQAAARVRGLRFDEAAARETRWKRLLYCMQTPRDLAESLALLALVVLLAVVCSMLVPNWGSAATRLMKPWDFVPSVGKVKIQGSPGNTEVLVGSNVEITGRVTNADGTPYQGVLYVRPQGGEESAVELVPDEKYATWRATLPSVTEPLQYRLEIGDSQTEIYSIQVRQKPTIKQVEISYTYPGYTRLPPHRLTKADADLDAPQCTVAELRIEPSTPIASGHVDLQGQRYIGRVEDGGTRLVVEVPMLNEGTFTIQMANTAGHTDPNPRVNRLRVTPDKPPAVEIVKQSRQDTVAPGAGIPVRIRATDDYGLGRIRLEMKVKKEGDPEANQAAPGPDAAPIVEVRTWSDLGDREATVSHQLELPADKAPPGSVVMLRAVATDQRQFDRFGMDLKPQESATPWVAVRVVDPDAKAQAALEQAESLRTAIFKILEKQIRARVAASTILQRQAVAERARQSAEVRASQVEIQKAATAVVQSVTDTDSEDRRQIKRAMNRLAFGEMLEAVRICDELGRQTRPEGFQGPVPQLLAVQDKIIEELRKILDVARQAQTEALAEMKKRPGGDLPDDTRKKLEDARRKMEEFLKAQKKIIEASENLAKKPVEDFSEEEEQLLKQLAAAEDDWARFMKELASDLSKLPEQDFANSSVAKELVEIQTEIKMAEDALLKKSADIAVPLEQLGYEMAEELTTNLEKWLPDTPDREKWSQEEALADDSKEAPMAELPGELEDLIGDLMEDEEDLFDEMEDVSSSAADSLDKGAGWDVADGPISNMSAKGATGNRLPNTNEIGGRAGEGRQGKSSGEFVSDEAVGKGGRRTPSRLTPDPIMKGQIKDHSKEPPGGATGGGKESGQGGEGLEGPAPNAPGPRDLARLAGKQAALRNKAEGIDAQFQVLNFHHQDLKKLIELMAQVEADLRAGNYQNALRQRKVLAERANNVREYLRGEFQVRQDASVNLPAEIQKEMLGAMHDPSPPGWEEMNRQYFERLATSGAAAAPPAAPASVPAGPARP